MRTILLGDIGNRLDIEDAEREIASLRATHDAGARTRESEIKMLKKELGEQKLAIQALTRFLVVKGVVQQDEIDQFIEKVDAEDGVVDGRLALEPGTMRLKFEKKIGVKPGTYRQAGDLRKRRRD